MDTAEFPKLFSGYFDYVICDAPCSGEGMFRKYDEAIEEWSEENVKASAKRQSAIMDNCASAVRPGGYLIYSTCTYSMEENEENVVAFLSRHPDFSIRPVSVELVSITAPGIPPKGYLGNDITLTRRFYPHRSLGEGQYIALLQKDENSNDMKSILYKDASITPSKAEISVVEKFLYDNMNTVPKGRFIKQGSGIALLCHKMPVPNRGVFMPGVMLGEIKGNNFFPHHHFFTAFGRDMKRVEELTRDDPRVNKYLHGEEIDTNLDGGWCAVCYEGMTLGGGKVTQGKIKNHYPKGLRLMG
jgi:NOL1/NOP2/fmu family ribosome biogenesis protein